MMHYSRIVAPAALILSLAACQRHAAAPKLPPQPVRVVTLQAQPVQITTQLPGRTEAFEIAQVRPQVSGVIQKRLFQEGTDVQAGQQLYQIDPGIYQAAVDTAQGQLLHAQANEVTARAKLNRYGPLLKRMP